MNSPALGRLFGTEVRVHWTWVPVLALVVVFFGIDLNGPIANWPAGAAWGTSIALAALVFISSAAHELAHVFVARRNGIGGAVVLVQVVGGPYVMESRPISAGQEFRSAAAGPFLSAAVAAAMGLVYAGFAVAAGNLDNAPIAAQSLAFLAGTTALYNMGLMVITLVPGYPLDGARVLHAIAWRLTGTEIDANDWAVKVGRWVGIAIIVAGALVMAVWEPLYGLSIVVAGWLVVSSSRLLERRSLLQSLIAGVKVGDATDESPNRVPPQLTLDVFATSYLAELMGTAALVERGTELLGLIGTAQIRRIPRARWMATRTDQAMIPVAAVPHAAFDSELWPALEVLERSGLDALIVDPAPGAAGGASAAAPAPAPADADAEAETAAGPSLLTRRSAAHLVQEKARQRQRLLGATAARRGGLFRGR